MDSVSFIQQDSQAAVAISQAALTTVATITNVARRLLCFQFNPAVRAVSAFAIYGRAHGSAELLDFTPTDWGTLPSGGRIRETSVHTTSSGARVDGDLNSVAVTENGYFAMDIDGLAQIVVKAKGTTDGTGTVASFWSLQ
jgi:hypothetical protein